MWSYVSTIYFTGSVCKPRIITAFDSEFKRITWYRFMGHKGIRLETIKNDEFESLFVAVKQGLYPHVEAVFGWCEEFQRKRLSKDYKPHWFHWVYSENSRVGVLCYKPYDNALHVHLLIIFPEFQNQKLGKEVMNTVHQLAYKQGRSHITLSSFVRNESAIRFYQSLGYYTVESEEHFVSLKCNIVN